MDDVGEHLARLGLGFVFGIDARQVLGFVALGPDLESLCPGVELLRRIAARQEATPAQVALAWLLAGKTWIVPIPGTTKLHRLEENIAAADLALTSDDLREIEEAQLEAQGARYAEAQQRMIDR